MKNVLLIFLSPVQLADKSVRETSYENLSGEPTHNTNESAVRYILQNGETLDQIFILASKDVREKPVVDGKTSLQYFLERLSKFTPAAAEIFPYDEKSSGAENLKSVAEMAGLIQNFAQNDEVTLHVDLTGGMRHIIIIMLDIVRLLEYSGIKIGRLIYSNFQTHRVEEVNSIYDLFQLISGVEEFVQFGSVKALNEYYRDKNLSPALKKLVSAMKNFAEEIKLCHSGRLKEAIENLHDAVNDFEAGDDPQDILMDRLIGRIRADYKKLISKRERDDLSIIRWCVEHDYLQQALTLYVERIPEYLGERFLAQSEAEANKLQKAVAKDDMHRERWYYLLNECKARRDHSAKAVAKFCDRMKNDAMQAIKKRKFSYDDWWANLSAELEPFKVSCTDEPLLRQQLELIDELWKNPALMTELSAPKLEPIRAIIDKLSPELQELPPDYRRIERVVKFIAGEMKNDDTRNYFPEFKFAVDIARKYPKSLELYKMIDEEIFAVQKMSVEEFLSIMDRYFRLKLDRNDTNHARAELNGEFQTAGELRSAIEEGLKEIGAAVKKYLETGAEHE